MSILTILKANIRHKKGTFVSIAVLLFVISMAVASIISIRKTNIKRRIRPCKKVKFMLHRGF